jgi:CDP-glucose 4,6-dehydratase
MSYLKAQGVALASARAGNVIGGGDWSKDRLIPDAVRAWQSETALTIRRPQATRPWQHVLEPLSGYMALAERLHRQPEIAGSFNFGPPSNEAVTVREVVEQARGAFGCGDVIYDQTELGPHEAGWLALETAKVRQTLGIAPRWTLPQSISRTMGWYQAVHRGGDARQWCMSDMDAYGMNP